VTSTPTGPTAAPSPGCGNGVVEPGEQCDLGDLVSGDGCDGACQFETLVPGGGSRATDCISEFAVVNPLNDPLLGPDGLLNMRQTCVEGDPTCDADGLANDECVFRVAICLTADDPALPECLLSTGMARYKLQNPRPSASDPTRRANALALLQAFGRLTSAQPGGRGANVFLFDPPLNVAAPDNCTDTVEVVVPLNRQASREEKLRIRGEVAPPPNRSSGPADRDRVRLICVRP
jgi:cysteine-rich repeat protein